MIGNRSTKRIRRFCNQNRLSEEAQSDQPIGLDITPTEDPSQSLARRNQASADMASTAGSETKSVASLHQPRFQNTPNMDWIENPEQYEKGGYHPVLVDELLEDRFEVVHKLGWGGIATVWLCMDHQKKKWCAVKILSADCSSEDCPDLKALKTFQDKRVSPSQAASHGIIIPDEHFWIDGPNGRHLCLVQPVLGMRLDKRVDTSGQNEMDFELLKNISYQMVRSMEFLHSKGLCHGDFRPSNILMKVKNLDHITQEQMLEILGIPEGDLLLTCSGEDLGPEAPEYVVTPASLERFNEAGLLLDEIAVVDFGESYDPQEPPSFLGIPDTFAAPEIIFGGEPGFGTDIWALACTILHLYESPPWGGSGPQRLAEWMEIFLGPLPASFHTGFRDKISKYEKRRYRQNQSNLETERSVSPIGLEENGGFISAPVEKIKATQRKTMTDTPGYSDVLAAKIGRKRLVDYLPPGEDEWTLSTYEMPREEVLAVTSLVRGMLQYQPQQRTSTSQIMANDWFKEVNGKNSLLPAMMSRAGSLWDGLWALLEMLY
ncbi:kinase-like domain-containing protein [Xylariaceae sp. FL0804]|nr:kinase-like domain-containing protein [Xylariaceae sp. FL0804]